MKKLIGIALLSIISQIAVHAQVQTIFVPSSAVSSNSAPYAGGTSSIPSNSIATVKSIGGPGPLLTASFPNCTVGIGQGSVFAGPATIQITQLSSYQPGAFATIAVEPGPFPPGQTATIGAYAGNVQVTMQTSTDLVNWTAATSGQVYTNSPAARFFRIQLLVNATP